MFRVPTLRNVTRLAHKSSFTTKFPPEVPETVDHEHAGQSRLTDQEIADLIAFLRTLNDANG